jgi:hypothetical protein
MIAVIAAQMMIAAAARHGLADNALNARPSSDQGRGVPSAAG